MPAGDYVVTVDGSLAQSGRETLHAALEVDTQTVAEGDLVIEASSTVSTHLTVAAASGGCGETLTLVLSHPSGSQPVLAVRAMLDLP